MPEPFRALLVATNAETRPYPVYPLGAAIVARVIEELDAEVRGIDCSFLDDPVQAVAEAAAEHRPRLVGISLRAVDTTCSLDPRSYLAGVADLVAAVRRGCDAPVVIGGSGYSLFPELLLDSLDADYGVVGEGEETISELAACLGNGGDPSGIRGLLIRAGGRVVATPRRAPSPVSRWRRPSLAAFPLEAHLAAGGMASVQSKRGCPMGCTYCTYPQLEGSRLRLRPPAEVVAEVAELAATGVDYLFFVDNNFNLPSEHAAAICRGLAALATRPSWTAFLTPHGYREELPELMAIAGASSIELGSESAAPEVLRALGKSHDAAGILAWDRGCTAAGIAPAHYFILGGPAETDDTVTQSLELIHRLSGPVAVMVGVRVYPGTTLHRRAVAEGVVDPSDTLLEPRYYLSPRIDPEALTARLAGECAGRRNLVVIGAERAADQLLIDRLRQRGRKGPLWEYLRP